jgi:uracil-DNA glycosylase
MGINEVGDRPLSKFSDHRDKWNSCMECGLWKTRKNVVLARGSIPCDILFIGEAPGTSEDAIGQPFIGPAGKMMDMIINRVLDAWHHRATWAFTNLVCCIPLGEDGTKTAEPNRESIQACASRLTEFIGIAKPKLIVRVGKLSTKWLASPSYRTNVPMVDVVHPAHIVRADISQQGLAIQRTVVTLVDAFQEYV